MARWSPRSLATHDLIALTQLASLVTFGLLLVGRWPTHPAISDFAFIICFMVFAAAALGVARSLRGVHRVVFSVFSALAWVTAGTMTWVLFFVHGTSLFGLMRMATDLELAVAVATLNALLSVYGNYAVTQGRRTTAALERSVQAERLVSATLEQAVAARTRELEEAQRILQRMWWLGQHIATELKPQRVLDSFLQAVMEIGRADGAVVVLLGEDSKLRVVAGAKLGKPWVGHIVPLDGSALGRVLRTGEPWAVADVAEHADEVDPASFEPLTRAVKGLAVVPILRRNDRIGAVVVGSAAARLFTAAELEHFVTTADLLSVALENAELVETLRQAEWRFRTLFRSAPDAVFTVLQSGRIREANDAVREMIGYDPVMVVGRELADLVLDAERPAFRAALAQVFAGAPTRVEVSIPHFANGSRRMVALAMARLPEADPPSVLVLGRDMTGEREMRLRLMESDRLAAVGELVAGVAHEVNNPLSSISAFAQLLLRDGDLTPTQRDSIEVIKAETMRASQVVRDLLAFARRSEPLREAIDLNAVVARTLRLREYQMGSSHVRVQHDLAVDIPAVLGDARQLQQVCLNLVTNAVQAMGSMGGGTLTVLTYAGPQEVVLEVRDTGPGIPDGVRAHIFEPFFTTKREGEGTGLGLSVSYGIVTAHGGRIEVAETSPAGTVFRVTLPAAEVAAQAQPVPDIPGVAPRSPLAGLRLLFVDDEVALRTGVESFGAMRGFTVITAADGLQALDVIARTGVDAVVCDLRMPGMDGPAFYERLRRERPGLAARTVFVTGDVVSAGRGTATRQPLLTKPFAFERLEEVLVALVRGKGYAATA